MKRSPQFIAILFSVILGYSVTPAAAQQGAAVAIEHVTVIDGTGRPAIPDATVLVLGGRIVRVARGEIALPPGTQRVDGHEKYLIPGLMDIHIHLRGGMGKTPDERTGIRAFQSYLYCGVTTVLDVGNNPDFTFALRDQERHGAIVSTRLLAVGGIVTYPGSHGGKVGGPATLVDSWPQAIPALDAAIARHPDFLKITYEEEGWGTRPMIALLPIPLMQHIVEYYNDHGIRSTVHVSSEIRAREAIYVGVDTLAHPDIQGPVTDDFVRLMVAKQMPMASTLTIGENYSRLAEHPEFLDQPLYRAVLEPEEIQRLKTTESERQKQNRWAWWMRIMTPVAQENNRKINAAGGIVALGTDQSIGPAVHRELELLVGGGIPPMDAIRIGTLNSARFLGKDRDMGSVEEGKIADLVLLNASPLEDINNAKQISMVMKAGKIIDRSKLDLPVNRKAAAAGHVLLLISPIESDEQ
ncbi:MAG TPA: amidohydrolase family protein [Candidatus Dormibacteraeota bacterium]|nr:amidohydrolase family protein [Candidatus Dormibacteraeota bacterium]